MSKPAEPWWSKVNAFLDAWPYRLEQEQIWRRLTSGDKAAIVDKAVAERATWPPALVWDGLYLCIQKVLAEKHPSCTIIPVLQPEPDQRAHDVLCAYLIYLSGRNAAFESERMRAMEVLYDRHVLDLLRFAQRRGLSQFQAKDVIHDAFLSVWTHWMKLQDVLNAKNNGLRFGHPRAILYTTVLHKIFDTWQQANHPPPLPVETQLTFDHLVERHNLREAFAKAYPAYAEALHLWETGVKPEAFPDVLGPADAPDEQRRVGTPESAKNIVSEARQLWAAYAGPCLWEVFVAFWPLDALALELVGSGLQPEVLPTVFGRTAEKRRVFVVEARERWERFWEGGMIGDAQRFASRWKRFMKTDILRMLLQQLPTLRSLLEKIFKRDFKWGV